MESFDDPAKVVAATARLIEEARAHAPWYGRGHGASSSLYLAPIFKGTRTRLRECSYDKATAMALPADDGDGYVLGVDGASNRADIEFSIRHELAHILAGEVGEALFLTSEDTMSFSERRADLFAITDITATAWFRAFVCDRRGRVLRNADLIIAQAYRELTVGWSEQRLWDRSRLRVQLYREHGI